MKIVTFPYCVSFGKGDNSESEVDVKLTEKENSRLERSARKEPRWQLDEDETLEDIYEKVYAAIVKQNQEVFTEEPDIAEEMLEWCDWYEPGTEITGEVIERYLEELHVCINYPEELQNFEDDENDE